MESLIIEPTKSTPLILLDPRAGFIRMKGESYPENAAKFFSPVFSSLREFLVSVEVKQIVADIEMTYFNSSSSKVFMNLFELLEQAVSDGKTVVVNWRYHPENEAALEAGEEFKEDAQGLTFNLVEISAE